MDSLDLSRRAVAAGWKWQEGVRVVGGATVTYADGVVDIVMSGDANVRRWHGEGVDPLLPDFNDAATRGVLLEQVRERWGDAYMTPCWTGANVYGWIVRSRDGVMLVWGHDSESAALVAALEAAPKR